MEPRKLFADERFTGICVYCGGEPETRDHVPSRVLLDEPFPPELPIVRACESCNSGFSKDEQYLACLLECVICGTVESALVGREKIRRVLEKNPLLASRIARNCRADETGSLLWEAEVDRVQNVVLKLARGHAAYEYSEPQLQEPESISFAPIPLLSEAQLHAFETPPVGTLFPEIGSRAFHKVLGAGGEAFTQEGAWRILQEERYRYSISHSYGIRVRMVLSDYLACEVIW
jgi:hypothetical protein